ncbi:MAG: DUF4233 domain-containing protein [Nocardioides sp.]
MKRSAQRGLCAGMITLQAIVLFLTGVALIGTTSISPGKAIAIGGGLAAACFVAAGTMRRPIGFWLGHLIQVVSVALGFVVTTMFFLGVVFGALWFGSYFLGAKIDRERAEREVLEQQWRAEHGEPEAAAGD